MAVGGEVERGERSWGREDAAEIYAWATGGPSTGCTGGRSVVGGQPPGVAVNSWLAQA